MARERLPIDTLASGPREIEVQVTDSAGNVGTTVPRAFVKPETVVAAAPTMVLLSQDVDQHGWLNLVLEGPAGGWVEASVGDELFQANFSLGTAQLALPTSPSGPQSVTLVASNGSGRRSKPLHVLFRSPSQVPASIFIGSATIGSRPVAELDRIIGEVEIELEIGSCSPLATLELRNRRGLLLAEGTVVSTGPCTYSGTVAMHADADPRDFVLHVADHWNNQSQSSPFQLSSSPPGSCPEPEVIEPLGSFVSPWRIQVPEGVDARASARGPSSKLYSLAEAFPSSEFRVYPGVDALGLDMQETRIEVTVAQDCNGLIVASRTDFAVIADLVPPALRAQTFGREGTAMTITASDGGELSRLEATWFEDGLEASFDAQPFQVPVRPGKMQLRAIDSLGNASSREIDMHVYPSGTRNPCEGGVR